MSTLRAKIKDTISDLVTNLLYYDRKEDAELPIGTIDEAIHSGEITLDEIVDTFRSEIESNI